MKTVIGGNEQRTELRRGAASTLAGASSAAGLLSERLCLAGVTSESVRIDQERLASAACLAERLEAEVLEIMRTAHPDCAASLADCLANARARADLAWEDAQAYAAEMHGARCA